MRYDLTEKLTYFFLICEKVEFWWHADRGCKSVHVKGAVKFGQGNIMQNVAIVVLGVDINAFQFAHRLRKDEGILPIDSATDLKKSSRLVS